MTGLKPETIYHFKVESLLRSGSKYKAQRMSAVFTAKTKQPAQLNIEDFYIYEVNGKEHKISQFAGKPIVIYFWSRNGYTVEPNLECLNKLSKKYGSEINFVVINCEGKSLLNYVKKYISDLKLDMPMYYDWSLNGLDKQGTNITPYFMVINGDGNIVKTMDSVINNDTLTRLVESVLS